MSSLAADTVTERLKRLETALRRGRALAAGAGIVLALLALSGASQQTIPEEIRARRFVLVDGGGKARAELTVGPDDMTRLTLYDLAGRRRAELGVHVLDAGMPALSLYDEKGKEGALLAVVEASAPMLALTGEKSVLSVNRDEGKPTAQLDVGSGSMSFYDRDQKARVILGVGAAGWPGLTVYDKDQRPRVVFGEKPDGSTGLSFVGRSGARVSAGFVQGRFPVLTLHDEDGKARAMMGVSPDGAPRLDLVDQDGVVIWKAP
jgi:hypothetical protein